ncbi:MAG: FMNH2-dependent monooxygenase, partial [Saccharopolyspora sp.]|nr:FMNH2-dependent monooxygenase [Saccharopolyspora sp.]
VVVALDADAPAARRRLARLDELAGEPLRSDAAVFSGDAPQLADLLEEWRIAGIEGFRLRPAVLPLDLDAIVDRLVPELHRRGSFRTGYGAETLRERFGLPRQSSRYAVEVA